MLTSKISILFLIVTPIILCEFLNSNCEEWVNSENSELLIEYIKWREISYLVIFEEDLTTGNLYFLN